MSHDYSRDIYFSFLIHHLLIISLSKMLCLCYPIKKTMSSILGVHTRRCARSIEWLFLQIRWINSFVPSTFFSLIINMIKHLKKILRIVTQYYIILLSCIYQFSVDEHTMNVVNSLLFAVDLTRDIKRRSMVVCAHMVTNTHSQHSFA
jgi:hypothetical protein